jgi:hypothetical protein
MSIEGGTLFTGQPNVGYCVQCLSGRDSRIATICRLIEIIGQSGRLLEPETQDFLVFSFRFANFIPEISQLTLKM